MSPSKNSFLACWACAPSARPRAATDIAIAESVTDFIGRLSRAWFFGSMRSVVDDNWISVVLEAHVHGLSARFPAVIGAWRVAPPFKSRIERSISRPFG